MADRQPVGASPVTPSGASPTATDETSRRIAELERQVHNLQLALVHLLGDDGSDSVARISQLRDLADTLGLCFEEHAAHIDATRERVEQLEHILRERPDLTSNPPSEQGTRRS